MNNLIKEQFQEAQKVLTDFLNDDEQLNNIDQAAQVIVDSIKAGGKVISCGNGGFSFCVMDFSQERNGGYWKIGKEAWGGRGEMIGVAGAL